MGTVQEDAFHRSCCEGATNVTEEQKFISMHRHDAKKKEVKKFIILNMWNIINTNQLTVTVKLDYRCLI